MEYIKYQTRTPQGTVHAETLLDCLHNSIENLGTWENELRLSGWGRTNQKRFEGLPVVPVNPFRDTQDDSVNDEHETDSDCTLDENSECYFCHVWHGDPCYLCGGRGFHVGDCDGQSFAQVSAVYPRGGF